jgi:hypothetical protein
MCVVLDTERDKLTSSENLGNSKQPHESWSSGRSAWAHLPFTSLGRARLSVHAYQMLNASPEVMSPVGEWASERARGPWLEGKLGYYWVLWIKQDPKQAARWAVDPDRPTLEASRHRMHAQHQPHQADSREREWARGVLLFSATGNYLAARTHYTRTFHPVGINITTSTLISA